MNFNDLIKKLNNLNYREYFYKNKLNKLFNSKEIVFNQKSYKFDYIFKNNNKKAYPPEIIDLIRLHYIIRLRKITTILELGIGYSTLVMSHAIEMNRLDYKLFVKNNLRRGNPFEIHSVDTSLRFIKETLKRIPKKLKTRVKTYFSEAEMTLINNQFCSEFKKLPNICPDFIYVDGPSFMHVKGQVNGINTRHIDRTIIGGDLIKLESLLLPGTLILWDGLTAYARFVEKNLKRDWKFKHLPNLDITVAEQIEKPLGIYNKKQIKFCLKR